MATLAAKTAVEVGDAIVTTEIAVVTRKQGRANFATAADHAAERAIVARLTAGYPDIPVLAEESATKALRKAERLWVDGYLSFHGRIEREEWVKQAKALAKGGVDEYIRVFGKKPV